MLNFEETLDVILEYHYSLAKDMIENCRDMKVFIKRNDQARAIKKLYFKILDELSEDERKRYYRVSREKFNAFARIVHWSKTKKTEEDSICQK